MDGGLRPDRVIDLDGEQVFLSVGVAFSNELEPDSGLNIFILIVIGFDVDSFKMIRVWTIVWLVFDSLERLFGCKLPKDCNQEELGNEGDPVADDDGVEIPDEFFISPPTILVNSVEIVQDDSADQIESEGREVDEQLGDVELVSALAFFSELSDLVNPVP